MLVENLVIGPFFSGNSVMTYNSHNNGTAVL